MQICIGCQPRLGASTSTPQHRSQKLLAGNYHSRCQRRTVKAQAKEKTTGNAALDSALDVGRGFVDTVSTFVPESVPRPVAKGGVAAVGVLLAFAILQKLVSTVLTIALLGGAAWFYFQYGSGGSSDGGSSSSNSSDKRDAEVDLDDPLAEARRIMDKYKK